MSAAAKGGGKRSNVITFRRPQGNFHHAGLCRGARQHSNDNALRFNAVVDNPFIIALVRTKLLTN